MKELIGSLIQFIIFTLLFFSFHKSYNKNLLNIDDNSIFKTFSINIVLFLNILLFFSFLKINLNIFYYLLFIIFLFNIKNYYYFIKEIKIFYFFFLINIIFFFDIAQNPILGWDGQAIWYHKAYSFFIGGNFFTLAETHLPEYPHLGSLLWSFFWKNSYLKLEYFGRFAFIFIYCVSFFLYLGTEKKNYKNILLLFFLIFITFDQDLFRGYQEVLIFSLINIFMYFYISIKKKNIYFLILCILICNLIIWVKNEGILFIVPIIFLFLRSLDNKKIYKKIFIFAILSFLIIRINLTTELAGYFRFQGPGYAINSILIQLSEYNLYFYRIVLILKYFIISFFKYPIWLIFFILLFFSKKLILRNISFVDCTIILIYLFLLNFMIFFVSSANLEWHLSVALDRLNYVASAYFFSLVYINLVSIRYYNHEI